jgi:hypothetical protein
VNERYGAPALDERLDLGESRGDETGLVGERKSLNHPLREKRLDRLREIAGDNNLPFQALGKDLGLNRPGDHGLVGLEPHAAPRQAPRKIRDDLAGWSGNETD